MAEAKAEALPQFNHIEEINAEDSSSKLEEYLCISLDQGAKVKSCAIFGSDRSPRCADLGSVCVCLSVHFMQ